MAKDHAHIITTLRDNALLPEPCKFVFLSGSMVRGWGNPTSDLDITLITDEPWVSPSAESSFVALDPPIIKWEKIHADGRPWDIEYWQDSQVDQALAKVSHEAFNGDQAAWKLLTEDEIAFLERIPYAVAASDGEWLAERREQQSASAYKSVLVSRSLDYSDSFVEDSCGAGEAGDLDSAVLSARLAFGHAIDALLASHGEFGHSPKWRARRFLKVGPQLLTFDRYWSVETMRTFDPAEPARWIEEVISLCQRVSMEVEV
ncbi:hypothetical protein [Streptosporangium subroseum]|uniref:hypothetical protein n=1 Tax=Streptosporangium subroseum TaxID=106412 RepID=UPI00308FA125|nr:nucleotidyltransferase domain-containing protein [Streptosporangium subroseum]